MNIMIVGGTGFLGYYATLAALARGHRVTSLSIDDIDLAGWYPTEATVRFGNVFTMSEAELTDAFSGYDALIYAVGPDDRVTPPAPAYAFFHEKLVERPEALFRAAQKAGVRRAAVCNSYFASFARLYPEKELARHHAYVRCRVEQAERLIAAGGDGMDVMILELPYIFGSMPKRVPLWKDVYIERFFRKPVIVFPKGGTTMIAAEHVGEALVGALEYGEHGARYPVGDENRTFRYMIEVMEKGLGIHKPIWLAGKRLCAMGAKQIARQEAGRGRESGLDMERLMLDVMGEQLYLPDNDGTAALLHYGRGGLEASILETVRACYPDGF